MTTPFDTTRLDEECERIARGLARKYGDAEDIARLRKVLSEADD